MSVQNKAARQRFADEIWNQGNVALTEELCTPDVVFHISLAPGGKMIGPAAFAQFVSMQRKSFANIFMTIDDLIAEADKVVARWTITGTHVSEFLGVAPTNAKVTLTAIDVSRFRNGRVAEVWISSDIFGLLRQLGVTYKPDDAPSLKQ